MKQFVFFLCAACLGLCALSSCTTVDPEFAALEPRLLASPAADAIVGMWYRKEPHSAMRAASTHSLLFSANGSGQTRLKMVTLGDESFYETPFTWRYDGAGRWKLTTKEGEGNYYYRTTGKELICFQGASRTIYVRSE